MRGYTQIIKMYIYTVMKSAGVLHRHRICLSVRDAVPYCGFVVPRRILDVDTTASIRTMMKTHFQLEYV